MSPAFQSLLSCSSIVFIFVCVECGDFQIQPRPIQSNSSEVSKIDAILRVDTNIVPTLNTSNANMTNTYREEIVKNFSSSRPSISSTKHLIDAQDVHKAMFASKDLTEFALEGGGIVPIQNSSLKSPDDSVIDEEFHNKGSTSKGRKGVKFPGSSVVPRKGVSVATVENLENLPNTTTRPLGAFTNSLVNNNNGSISSTTTLNPVDSKATPSDLEITKPQAKSHLPESPSGNILFTSTHLKKPEYVSDEKDVDDFDKYSIIKTSTTGEDYVIIGIVIVIGIWFSVFGALIFYRRAGEYWDRRHYRRMDFLVEGMYND